MRLRIRLNQIVSAGRQVPDAGQTVRTGWARGAWHARTRAGRCVGGAPGRPAHLNGTGWSLSRGPGGGTGRGHTARAAATCSDAWPPRARVQGACLTSAEAPTASHTLGTVGKGTYAPTSQTRRCEPSLLLGKPGATSGRPRSAVRLGLPEAAAGALTAGPVISHVTTAAGRNRSQRTDGLPLPGAEDAVTQGPHAGASRLPPTGEPAPTCSRLRPASPTFRPSPTPTSPAA